MANYAFMPNLPKKKLLLLIVLFTIFAAGFYLFYTSYLQPSPAPTPSPTPTPLPTVPNLLQKYSQDLQKIFLKAEYGKIQVPPVVEIPLAEVEKKFSRKGENIATGSSYVSGYLGGVDSEENFLVIRLSGTEWIKTKVEENAPIKVSNPEEDELRVYGLKEGFSQLKIGDWITVLCTSQECQSASRIWVYRSLEETEKPLGGSKDWTQALPLGWCPPVERCWERLIKYRPTASDTDVLMRGIVQSIDPTKNEVSLLMEGGSAKIKILPETVFSHMIAPDSPVDPNFSSFSHIKKDDILVVRCAYQANNCSYVDSVVKVE